MPVKDRSRFSLLQQVDVSCDSHYDPIRHSFTPRKQITPATFAVTWPDGTPCSLIEMRGGPDQLDRESGFVSDISAGFQAAAASGGLLKLK